MKVLNDFECTQCGVLQVDKYLDNETSTVDCLHCNGTAKKVRSVPRFVLPGNDPAGFPTAHANWEKKRIQKIAQETKADNS
jgi:hypothetical protein